ncbi:MULTISPECIES: DUF7344 domain-containing protein [Halorussus]|uniref:DUF7344 domain-containing protein n=1 Tax=Halorussus TaxID=1070314 RepID=UPI00209E971F|nr:hypothetical protein [Halorussus vallis]USZ76994.1 hypothetical protein NGM07_06610 [Halorussus vallis]
MSDAMSRESDVETERTLDHLLRLLADRHRRYTLYHLNATEFDVVTLDEVADYVAERDQQDMEEQERMRDTTHERIRMYLHHNHLPKLAEAGLIDYDARSQTIRNWSEPSLMEWAQDNQNELPLLRSLFWTPATQERL